MATVTVDNRRINFIDGATSNIPVLLLHDFPLHAGAWQHLLHERSDDYRLLAVDLVGFGGSDVLPDLNAYGIPRWADDVAGVLRAQKVDRALVVGNGLGGVVGLELWRRHPDLVGGLALLAVPMEPATTDEQETAEEWAGTLERDGDMERFIEAVLEETVTGTPRRGEVAKQIRQFARENTSTGLAGALRAIAQRPDQQTDLDKIDVPVLVVAGADDLVVPPDAAENAIELIPDADLVVVEDAAHFIPLDNPGECARLVDEFVASV